MPPNLSLNADARRRAYARASVGKTELELRMNPKFEAQETIDRAIANFDALFSKYDLPILPLAQRFIQESAEEVALEADIEDVLSPVVVNAGKT